MHCENSRELTLPIFRTNRSEVSEFRPSWKPNTRRTFLPPIVKIPEICTPATVQRSSETFTTSRQKEKEREKERERDVPFLLSLVPVQLTELTGTSQIISPNSPLKFLFRSTTKKSKSSLIYPGKSLAGSTRKSLIRRRFSST